MRSYLVAAGVVVGLAGVAWADEFDRLDGRRIEAIGEAKGTERLDSIGLARWTQLPGPLSGHREPLLILKTDQGNPAALLLTLAFRKPPAGSGKPVPIAILERFVSEDDARTGARLAWGRGVQLFDGFLFDLETGQVVPEGQGGDIRFVAPDETSARLEVVKPATMSIVTQAVEPVAVSGEPSGGTRIAPGDMAGRYRLFADGRWSGLLELRVDERVVRGQFRSDETGTSYPVEGEVSDEPDPVIRFAITMPRTRQEFQGKLFSVGKSAIVGTFLFLERESGFFAVREGARLMAGAARPGDTMGIDEGQGLVVRLGMQGGLVLPDGRSTDPVTLYREATAGGAVAPGVTVQVMAAVPYGDVARCIEGLKAAGFSAISLAQQGE